MNVITIGILPPSDEDSFFFYSIYSPNKTNTVVRISAITGQQCHIIVKVRHVV